MSGLKYHGGMKGLYAMLALTEASLVDDDVDTTPVRTKKRHDHEDEGQVTIHMRTRLGGGVRIWPSIKLRCRTTGTESKFIHAVGLSPSLHGRGWKRVGLTRSSSKPCPPAAAPLTSSRTSPSPEDSLWKTSRATARTFTGWGRIKSHNKTLTTLPINAQNVKPQLSQMLRLTLKWGVFHLRQRLWYSIQQMDLRSNHLRRLRTSRRTPQIVEGIDNAV